MLSATDFLPSHINELMNRVTIVELYRGSGRTSRLAATLLLGIKLSVSGCQFLVSGFWFWFSVFLKSSKGATAKKTGNQKLETRNQKPFFYFFAGAASLGRFAPYFERL